MTINYATINSRDPERFDLHVDGVVVHGLTEIPTHVPVLSGDGADFARHVLQTAVENLVIAGVEPDVVSQVASTLFGTTTEKEA